MIAALALLTVNAGAEEWEPRVDASGQWRYVLESDGARISRHGIEPKGDLLIPSELDGYAVTSISNFAFHGCRDLTSVTIPDSITHIGDWGFSLCEGLTSVIIPDSITSIGDYAFSGCSSLANVSIPNGVTFIGDYAFMGCSSLTSAAIPNSVMGIGLNPFLGCPLAYIDVSSDNPVYAQIDGVLFNMQQKKLVSFPSLKEGTYKIPEGILVIGANAFAESSGLISVTIPDSVTSIGGGAFYGCLGLTSVTIPDYVTTIGHNTFYNCSSLTNVTIPDSVIHIGENAFYGCNKLTLSVKEGSIAEQYARVFNIPYALYQ